MKICKYSTFLLLHRTITKKKMCFIFFYHAPKNWCPTTIWHNMESLNKNSSSKSLHPTACPLLNLSFLPVLHMTCPLLQLHRPVYKTIYLWLIESKLYSLTITGTIVQYAQR